MSLPNYKKIGYLSKTTVIEFISAERPKDFILEETKIFQNIFILNLHINSFIIHNEKCQMFI